MHGTPICVCLSRNVTLANLIFHRSGYHDQFTHLSLLHWLFHHIITHLMFTHTHLMFNSGPIWRRCQRRATQVFRPFLGLATMEERDVIKIYRLNTHTIMKLCNLLEEDLLPWTVIPQPLPPLWRSWMHCTSLQQAIFKFLLQFREACLSPLLV